MQALMDVYDTMLQARENLLRRYRDDLFDSVAVELNELDLLITLARELHPELAAAAGGQPAQRLGWDDHLKVGTPSRRL